MDASIATEPTTEVSTATSAESGARNVDNILTNTLLPQISGEFLTRMSAGTATREVAISVKGSEFEYQFS